ncbi:hypothetical protein SLEP1_g34785 [Rubroshorea leprosula]|uniref:Uncharacterized protein n=1 Tax=Rubroshorea leprosula TaxID=152421 RepID=A0AAV5KL37_9ROSI|nr:hypothetical protein SLEP1_g34785 [Rubroshorea leprosula]
MRKIKKEIVADNHIPDPCLTFCSLEDDRISGLVVYGCFRKSRRQQA